MSFFDAFIGGAAEQGVGIIDQQMKNAAELDRQKTMSQVNADIQEKKQKALLQLQEEMRNAPLNRLGAKAKEFAGQDVQVQAEPVTALSGQDPRLADGTDGVSKGMVGNYADLVAKAKNLPPEDQQPYLDQLKRQFGADQATAQSSIIGQVRKRSQDEAMRAAAEDAKVNDPVAYAAYEAQIGKPQRDERRLDNQDKRLDQQDTNTNRRMDIQQQFNEDHAARQRTMADIAETRAARMESRQGDQMDKAETQATRQSLSTVLKDIGTQEDKIQMKLLDPMLTPDQKSVLEGQFKTLDKDRVQARNELLKLAGVEPKEPTAPAKNGWDSGTGQVYKNGEVIGTAKSEQEGRSLYQGGAQVRAKAKGQDEAAAPTAPTQQFNEAGYADVQSTIDGAKRGDTKAIALLQQMIDRGETSPAQRQQIAKITGQK